MRSLILTTFMVLLATVCSDTTEDNSHLEELCSESYFDRLISTDRWANLTSRQVFHLYRKDRHNKGWNHYWKVTVNRTALIGFNDTLKAVSIEYLRELGQLPQYQMTIHYKHEDLGGVWTHTTGDHDFNETYEWITAIGFNALDDHFYALSENQALYLRGVKDRVQYFTRLYHYIESQSNGPSFIVWKMDPKFGQIPVFKFLGIECPEEEVDEELWIEDETLYWWLGVVVIFAFILPILILWKLEGRYRFTQEIYDDSRMGSDSAIRSATQASDAPADLTGVRKVRLSQMANNP